MARWNRDPYLMTNKQTEGLLRMVRWHMSRGAKVKIKDIYRSSGIREGDKTVSSDHVVLDNQDGKSKNYYWNTRLGRWIGGMNERWR
jgi:hypothetical protein